MTVIALARVLVDTARALASIPQYTSRSHALPRLHALLEHPLGRNSKTLQLSASHLDAMGTLLRISSSTWSTRQQPALRCTEGSSTSSCLRSPFNYDVQTCTFAVRLACEQRERAPLPGDHGEAGDWIYCSAVLTAHRAHQEGRRWSIVSHTSNRQ